MRKGFYALQLSPNERGELGYGLREYLRSNSNCDNKIELRGLNILKKVLKKVDMLKEKRRNKSSRKGYIWIEIMIPIIVIAFLIVKVIPMLNKAKIANVIIKKENIEFEQESQFTKDFEEMEIK